MNRSVRIIFGGVWLAAAVAATGVYAQDIYKTVDEDGNVVYTDQKPSEDAEPVRLPELTIVDPVDIGDPNAARSEDRERPDVSGPPMQILSPAADETIWNTAYNLSVSVAVDGRIPSGAQLVYLIDGEERMTTRAQSIELSDVFRGERQLSVEMRNDQGDVLSQAEPVTFYMRQHSRLHSNPN